MADLKESIFDGVKIRRPASAFDEPVRLKEYQAGLATKASSSSVSAAIAAQTHGPVTVTDSNSIDLTLAGQNLTADLKLLAASTVQAAGGPATENFSAIAAGNTITLAKLSVTLTSVERRNASNGLEATGVVNVDYVLDASLGTLYILPGSSLITPAGHTVKVIYTYAQVLDGSALTIDGSGCKVNLGPAHHQAARGDHVHTNDHRPATGGSTTTATVSVAAQVVSASVNLDPAGTLEVSGSSIRVKPGLYSLDGHIHANADGGDDGFMSAADKVKLDSLTTGAGPLTFTDSATVDFTEVGGSSVSASVTYGAGLRTGAGGLEPDFDYVAARDHTHADDPNAIELGEEFVGGSSVSAQIGQLGWTRTDIGGACAWNYAAAEVDINGGQHFGIFTIQTPAAAGQGGGLALGGGYKSFIQMGSTANWDLKAVFKLSSVADVRFRFGFANADNLLAPTQGIFLRYDTSAANGNDDSGGKFRFVCKDGSGETLANSLISADTNWHTCRIRTVGSSINFSVDSEAEVAVPSHLTDVGVFLTALMGTDAASAKILSLDFVGFSATGLGRY